MRVILLILAALLPLDIEAYHSGAPRPSDWISWSGGDWIVFLAAAVVLGIICVVVEWIRRQQ